MNIQYIPIYLYVPVSVSESVCTVVTVYVFSVPLARYCAS